MRGILEGVLAYRDVFHSDVYDLADIARVNDALDVKHENTRRAQEEAERRGKR